MGENNLKVYISEYYKTLFGPPAQNNISLVEEMNYDLPQISPQENNILTNGFNETEVFYAISQTEHNKAP